jgi:hypothetical protein
VPEGGVPRSMFGFKRDDLTEDLRNLRKEELHTLYFSLATIKMFKYRRVGRTGRGARRGEPGEDKCTHNCGGTI